MKAIANPAAQTLTDLPAMAATVSAKTIQLDDNPLGWKTAQLVFEDGQAWLTITTTAIPEERKFAIGLDGVYRKTEVKGIEASGISEPEQRYIYNPYEFNFVLGIPIDGAVAMRGEWKDDKRFILTVQDTRDVDLDILTFTFTPVDVKVEWQSHRQVTMQAAESGLIVSGIMRFSSPPMAPHGLQSPRIRGWMPLMPIRKPRSRR